MKIARFFSIRQQFSLVTQCYRVFFVFFYNKNPAYAVKLFDKILEKSPSSSRSIYGKALALNHLADQKRSNEILYRAIRLYTELLKMTNVTDALYVEAAERTIKVMRFVGTAKILQRVI